jgi:hypothetical protein
MNDVSKKAIGGLLRLVATLAVLLFVPVWTLDYWQAWVFLAVFSIATFAITLYLMKKDPRLLERRVNAGVRAEKEKSQKIIQSLATIAFVAVIAFPAFDHRFGWSAVPPSVVLAGDVLVALGLLVIFFVFRENTYTVGAARAGVVVGIAHVHSDYDCHCVEAAGRGEISGEELAGLFGVSRPSEISPGAAHLVALFTKPSVSASRHTDQPRTLRLCARRKSKARGNCTVKGRARLRRSRLRGYGLAGRAGNRSLAVLKISTEVELFSAMGCGAGYLGEIRLAHPAHSTNKYVGSRSV